MSTWEINIQNYLEISYKLIRVCSSLIKTFNSEIKWQVQMCIMALYVAPFEELYLKVIIINDKIIYLSVYNY